MNNWWCESCARKNNCYTTRNRPKCFVAITNTDRKTEQMGDAKPIPLSSRITQTDPQMIDQVKADIEKWSSWSKTYEAMCKDEPNVSEIPTDSESQTETSTNLEKLQLTELTHTDCAWREPCGK